MALYDVAKRILPRRIRAALRETLLRGVGNEVPLPDSDAFARLRRLEEEVFRISPPEIVRDTDVDRAARAFLKREQLDASFEVAISKHDAMYRYLDYFAADRVASYSQYLETGLEAFRCFEEIVTKRFGGFGELQATLDFACGHGRVTRFLVTEIEPRRLWVSDVKPSALEFQMNKLGVRGFLAPDDPAELDIEGRFDLVLVASFFTHLPERRFQSWLEALQGTLSENGVLVFSVSDMSECYAPNGDPFVHRTDNEDSFAPYIDDQLSHAEAYGTTWVSEEYVRGCIEKLGVDEDRVERLPKALWGNQDLWVVPAR